MNVVLYSDHNPLFNESFFFQVSPQAMADRVIKVEHTIDTKLLYWITYIDDDILSHLYKIVSKAPVRHICRYNVGGGEG
jgi:hypothetical protein